MGRILRVALCLQIAYESDLSNIITVGGGGGGEGTHGPKVSEREVYLNHFHSSSRQSININI